MMRDELIRQLFTLPEDTIIGVRIGDQHLDATRLMPWGDEGFVDLQCLAADLLDVLIEWKVSAPQRDQILTTVNRASPTEQRSVMSELLTALESTKLQREPGRWFLPGTPP
jgi:hypothetical protein